MAAGNIWDNLYSNQKEQAGAATVKKEELTGTYHFKVDSGRLLKDCRLAVSRNEANQTIQGALASKTGQKLVDFSFDFTSNEFSFRLLNETCQKLSFTSLLRFDFYNLKVLRNFLFFRDPNGTLTLNTPFDVLDASLPTVRIKTDENDEPIEAELFFVTKGIRVKRVNESSDALVGFEALHSTGCNQVSDISSITDEFARRFFEVGLSWWNRLTAEKPSLVPALMPPTSAIK